VDAQRGQTPLFFLRISFFPHWRFIGISPPKINEKGDLMPKKVQVLIKEKDQTVYLAEVSTHAVSLAALKAIRDDVVELAVFQKKYHAGRYFKGLYNAYFRDPESELYLSPSFFSFHSDSVFALKMNELTREAEKMTPEQFKAKFNSSALAQAHEFEDYLAERNKELEVDEEEWLKHAGAQLDEANQHRGAK